MLRRGSVWCGVAQYGAAWLSMVRRGSVDIVRRGSALWCGVAQLMVRRDSVDSASSCCKAGPSPILSSAPQGGFSPLSFQSDEEMETGERPRRMAMDKWIV